MNFDEVNQILKEYLALPEAKFGQNFLCDDKITMRIVGLADCVSGDNVLEIGPGIGAITRPLSALDVNLKCVEIDKRLVEILRQTLSDKVEVIDSDFLKLKDYGADNIDVVVSNLPYYIMTDIMKKLIAECTNSHKMVFMVEEAAMDRIAAVPRSKQYGPLSVLCSIYGSVVKEFNVPFNVFVPMPHTTSCVITLTRGDAKFDGGIVDFVDKCFAQRRKKLSKNLVAYDPQAISEAFCEIKLDTNCRAEELSPEQFLELYSILNK